MVDAANYIRLLEKENKSLKAQVLALHAKLSALSASPAPQTPLPGHQDSTEQRVTGCLRNQMTLIDDRPVIIPQGLAPGHGGATWGIFAANQKVPRKMPAQGHQPPSRRGLSAR
jgi:hypothetical protein